MVQRADFGGDLGDVLIVLAYIGYYLVFRENTRRRNDPGNRRS